MAPDAGRMDGGGGLFYLSSLGRAALLERSGVEEERWSAAILSLRTSGRVIQEGVKRWAIYKPVLEA